MKNLIVKEYLGNIIQFKIVDGYVYANATSMCRAFGKQPSDWLKIKTTQEYIDELNRSEDFPNELVKVVQGGKANEQGTWIHEKLILDLARWLNVKFRVWCDEQITTLLREGEVKIKSPVSDETKKKRLEIMEKNANVRMSKQYIKLAELTNDPRYKEVLIVLGTNTMSNKEILPLPKLEQKSYTAEKVGKILGISANMVGRLANKYNLKTEKYGYLAQDKAKNCNKSVESFRYYERAIDEIKKYID